ncbi:site-specific integrase [Aquisalimonas sp.]|uniref:site-specific integrase n=1 Tax=Aquisalimonas sp. TaxID=1872621 RepID=UPI0025BB8AE5|nr:site-specific integrase [Aquisalimonas sp.]
MNTRSPPFLERARRAIGRRHRSIRTEQADMLWVRKFIVCRGKRHPEVMAAKEVAAFLTYLLAVERRVSPSTQNQALNALVFLYRHVLEQPVGDIDGLLRAGPKRKPRTVLAPVTPAAGGCAPCALAIEFLAFRR